MILQTLYQQCIKRDVRFFNEFYVLDLLMVDGAAAGVVAYELATGELHVFRARAILFATGGYGRIFKITSNAHALTGDGPAVCYRRGIPLEDMEMYQFHPTGIYKMGILISEAVRGEGGILLNGQGERFMERYAPTIKDLAPRDMVSRAIYQEIKEGRGVDGSDYVHLDVRHLPREVIETKIPDVTEFARIYLGVEPTTEPVPIQPTAHYAMGGIPTNTDAQVVVGAGETSVPGLYAAGECACVSVHGANRLGTNSLLDIVVFGRRGGMAMAEFAEHAKQPALPEKPNPEADTERMLQRLLTGPNLEFAADIRAELQRHMFDLCGVVRTEEGLQVLHGRLQALRDRYQLVGMHDRGKRFNTELMEAVELGFLLDIAETVAAAALARDESRGGHYRDDHPLRDDDHWLRHSLAYREGEGVVRLEYKDVKLGPYVPMERKY
jgi:succinate dehydrogenase / fumarate reductase flavoprotein subunit